MTYEFEGRTEKAAAREKRQEEQKKKQLNLLQVNLDYKEINLMLKFWNLRKIHFSKKVM